MEKEKVFSDEQSIEKVEAFFKLHKNKPHFGEGGIFKLYEMNKLYDMKDTKTLENLFREVINTRGIHHQLGMNESTVRALRKQFNDGGSISVEKMREVLKLVGYKRVQEERWG